MTQRTYTGLVTRSAGGWKITIARVPGASAKVRTIDEAEGAARYMLAMTLVAAPDSFDVQIVPEITDFE
jgi:hypothetical protein